MNYIVRPGDTLFGIAARFGTTVDAIMRANRLQSPFIYVGQQLFIPVGQTPSPGPGPSPGPSPGPFPPTPGVPGNVERRLDRLENQVNRLENQVNRLNNRVQRIENQLNIRTEDEEM